MFLADYHTHTILSPDARNTMLEMASAEIERGITEMCFTNHAENCSDCTNAPNQFPPFERWDEMVSEFNEAKEKLGDKIELRLGLELGSPHHDVEEAKRVWAHDCLDFVIGSIHNLRGMDDFYFIDYATAPVHDLTRMYMEEYIELARTGYYDVLGHVGLIRKYMAQHGFTPVDFMEFSDLARELFKIAIEQGKGIELNVSGMFGNLGESMPDIPLLKLYKECGGEIVTVGSDAHRVQHAGLCVAEGYEILRSVGYKYVTVYRGHKPEFIRI